MEPGGRIVQINISEGGVPKRPVAQAQITTAGVVGDYQRNRQYHGGPDRALCLWSLEVIQTLQREGHPIAPGYAGENLTLAGLPWLALTPGSRLSLGAAIVIEITDYAAPCRTTMGCFRDRRYRRISQTHYPGSSRLYARVLRVGSLSQDDPVQVLTWGARLGSPANAEFSPPS